MATGKVDDSFQELDELIRTFIERNRVPGAGVAVTDHGRLVFARGYGYADIAKQKPVEPTSMFRIASISKPITAVAIMQLVEQGKLKLEDRVLEILKYEPHLEKGEKVDERWNEITVEQCLQHRGGWDRDVSFDGMFQSVRFARALKKPAPAQKEDVIRCMLGVPLDFNPGERYAYSNFGYNVLGRIIEKISKQDYESYVKEHVLAPVGIHDARSAARSSGRKHRRTRSATTRRSFSRVCLPRTRGRKFRRCTAAGTTNRWIPTARGFSRPSRWCDLPAPSTTQKTARS